MVPLVSSFMLSTKELKKTWIKTVIDKDAQEGWRFEVRTGALSKLDEDRLKTGTKAAKGQAFVCVMTGSSIELTFRLRERPTDSVCVSWQLLPKGAAVEFIFRQQTNMRRLHLPPPSRLSLMTLAQASCLRGLLRVR